MAPVTIDGVEYLDSAGVCAALGIKPATLYAYVSRGQLRSLQRGRSRSRLYPRADVDALLGMGSERGAASIDRVLPEAEDWITWTG